MNDVHTPRPQHATAINVVTMLSMLVMRLLAFAAMVTAGWLTWSYYDALADTGCADCAAVKTSDWGTVFGVPVSVPAIVLYAAMLAALIADPRRRPQGRDALWGLLIAASAAVFAAAGWFIYLQAAVIESWCTECLIEHAIGVTLAVLVCAYGLLTMRRRVTHAGGGALVGLLAVGLLVAAQHLDTHQRITTDTGTGVLDVAAVKGPADYVGQVDEHGAYREPDDDTQPNHTIVLKNGGVTLDAAKHPLLGSPEARYIAVEVVDYNCPRCRRLSELLAEARPILGDEYAVLVVLKPISSNCNPEYAYTEPKHTYACPLAKLAHAVWAIDASKFEAFHHFLFENQVRLRDHPDEANAKAVELVGASPLDAVLESGGLAEALVARDIDIARRMEIGGVPDLFVSRSRFTHLPDAAQEMADLLRRAFARAEAARGGG